MTAQTYVRFPQPITLDLRIPIEGEHQPPVLAEFLELPLYLHLDAVARTISAHLPPIPTPLTIYGPADFTAACPDEPEDHAARVMQCLGSDPADALQRLINGELPAMPPRIPREIPNWRAKAILASMGLTSQVDAVIASLPEPQRTVVTEAWAGDAKLARTGQTVLALGGALGMSAEQIDALFIAADAIQI
jgi:hypothetical protein